MEKTYTECKGMQQKSIFYVSFSSKKELSTIQQFQKMTDAESEGRLPNCNNLEVA